MAPAGRARPLTALSQGTETLGEQSCQLDPGEASWGSFVGQGRAPTQNLLLACLPSPASSPLPSPHEKKYKRKMRQCPGLGSPSPRDREMKSGPN